MRSYERERERRDFVVKNIGSLTTSSMCSDFGSSEQGFSLQPPPPPLCKYKL
jgi:hypothetical protein